MNNKPVTERRRHRRFEHSANLRFCRGSDGKLLPARSVDVSLGGMLLNVLASPAIREGQNVLLHLETDSLVNSDSTQTRSIPATIVHVRRDVPKTNGYLAVGVQFLHEQRFIKSWAMCA